MPFEHHTRDFDFLRNLLFVDNALVQFLFRWLLQVHFICGKLSNFLTLNDSHLNFIIKQKFLNQVKNVRDRSPFVQVGSSE